MPDQSCPYDGPLHPIWECDPEDPEDGLWVFDVAELTAEELAEMLRAHARGLYAEEAAVELLIAHRHWLHDPELRTYVDAVLGYGTDRRVPMASVAWSAVVEAIRDGGLYASTSEAAMLRIAASLASYPVEVGLRHALAGLDARDSGLVGLAIAHAAGERQEWPA